MFDDDLAQASGGYESRETLHRIRHLFASKRVTFSPEDKTKVRAQGVTCASSGYLTHSG